MKLTQLFLFCIGTWLRQWRVLLAPSLAIWAINLMYHLLMRNQDLGRLANWAIGIVFMVPGLIWWAYIIETARLSFLKPMGKFRKRAILRVAVTLAPRILVVLLFQVTLFFLFSIPALGIFVMGYHDHRNTILYWIIQSLMILAPVYMAIRMNLSIEALCVERSGRSAAVGLSIKRTHGRFPITTLWSLGSWSYQSLPWILGWAAGGFNRSAGTVLSGGILGETWAVIFDPVFCFLSLGLYIRFMGKRKTA